LAETEKVPAYVIFSDATLVEIATYLPQTTDELEQISGFGMVKIARYGSLFLNAIRDYSREHNLSSQIHNKQVKKRHKKTRSTFKEKASATQEESLRLFKSGKTIAEIAKLRGFVASTIETHLAQFVKNGTLSVYEFVSKEKLPVIEQAISLHGSTKLKPLKDTLGDSISYGEIKAVVNHLEYQKTVGK
jgi:ATP-dependent DNA helicase RecQ